jgi:type II secretory pathway pseudopilin PulG
MRFLLTVILVAASATYAQAQDPGQMAAQQATQQANQDALQAMQMTQQAARTAAQQAQMAQTDTPTPPCCITTKPKFSVKPGNYDSTVTVKLTDKTRGAIIYYTTDGWTPTAASNRYLGPITINTTTTLQAIAIAPYSAVYGRSLVVSGQYTINAPATEASATAATSSAPPNPPATPEAVPKILPDGRIILPQGTPVPLVFGADVNSKTAEVGDLIPLTLSEDLKLGNVTVARKRSAAVGLIIQVDHNGIGGAPGDITFQVNSLTVNGSVIQLRGFATKEGEAKPPGAARLIPYAGAFTVLKHGTNAEITAGTPFTAYVNEDTPLPPAN